MFAAPNAFIVGGKSPFVTKISDLGISGPAAYASADTVAGWSGPSSSVTSPSSAYLSFDLTGKKFVTGLRIILQSAGGASSNNDSDPDSSANSGATAVFDIPANGLNGVVYIWLGPGGVNLNSGGNGYNINPRPLTGITDPLGSYPSSTGQGGYTGSAAFDSAVLLGSTVIGYAEGGAATVNYDSPNSNVARPYVNSSYVTNVATYNGPTSPGRGAAPGNNAYPLWNFNQYSDLATCYGKYASVAGGRFGQGGWEAVSSGSGTSGFPAFVWISIL